MNKTILSTVDLSIGYNAKNSPMVLGKNINLNLNQGKLIALVGANGIGKSTLLRTLTGIQKPISGTVYLNEKDISKIDEAELSKSLSLVLTEKLPPSNLTVYELIALGRQPYTNWLGQLSSTDKEKVSEAIHFTKTEELLAKKHTEISDGQLQKVLIARALAQDTDIIVLDEPTTHLDLSHKVAIFSLLKKLAVESNKCLLFSTHDIDLAIQISDEMIVMTEEKLIQDQPCNLISRGIFETIFNDSHIQFDAHFGKFVIKDRLQ